MVEKYPQKRKVRSDPMARPRKVIDQKTFESCCAIQCTKAEICAVLDCDEKTLETWCKRTYGCGFSQTFEQKRGVGKVSLRRSQWRLAEKNTAMAIFLGKNYLGQKDTVEAEFNPECLKKAAELLSGVNSVIE